MNSELAQLVSLTAYGNAFLAGDVQPFPIDALKQSSSGFALTHSTTFHENGRVIANDPVQWFEYLLDCRTMRLWASRGIQADLRGGAVIWRPRWIEDAAHHGSDVEYHTDPSAAAQKMARPNLSQTEESLRAVLQDVFLFTITNGLPQWQDLFTEAMSILNQDTMISPNVLLPAKGFSDQARYIFDAATQAWVFGGAGSWSDIKMPDAASQHEYENITARLYNSVHQAILDAANSFEAP